MGGVQVISPLIFKAFLLLRNSHAIERGFIEGFVCNIARVDSAT